MAEQRISGLQSVGRFTVAGDPPVFTYNAMGLVDTEGAKVSFERNNEVIETAMSQVPYDVLPTSSNIKVSFVFLSASLENIEFALGLPEGSLATATGTKTLTIPVDGLGAIEAFGFYIKHPADTAGTRTHRFYKCKPSGNLELTHSRSMAKVAVELTVLHPDSGPVADMSEPDV